MYLINMQYSVMGPKIYMESIKDKKKTLRARCEEIPKLGGYPTLSLNFHAMAP